MFVASDDATNGSVIPNIDLIFPSNKGSNHYFFYTSFPYKCKVSIFPESGALQLKTSGAIKDLPIISQSYAYSNCDNPDLEDKNKFHNPYSFAFDFNYSIISGT